MNRYNPNPTTAENLMTVIFALAIIVFVIASFGA